jgi:hypothetical protein
MTTERSNPYDAPASVVDAIFGESVEAGDDAGGPASGRDRIVAQLDDVEEGLRLTLYRLDHGGDGTAIASPAAVAVADLAAADREINSFLKIHPDLEVVRAGDGWVTHSE